MKQQLAQEFKKYKDEKEKMKNEAKNKKEQKKQDVKVVGNAAKNPALTKG